MNLIEARKAGHDDGATPEYIAKVDAKRRTFHI